MTQLESARKGRITEEMETIARDERIETDLLVRKISAGTVVIPKNIGRELPSPRAVGEGLRTKVNANIGTSEDYPEVQDELAKLDAALTAGADAMMDLSTGGDLVAIRQQIMAQCPVPLGTVPIYEAAVKVASERFTHGGTISISSPRRTSSA